jgi:hypothetical protein
MAWLQLSAGRGEQAPLPPAPKSGESSAVTEVPVETAATEDTDPPAITGSNEPDEAPPVAARQAPAPSEPEPDAGAPVEDDGSDWIDEPEPEPNPPPVMEKDPPEEKRPVEPVVEPAEDVPDAVAPRILGTVRIRSRYPLSVFRGDEALAEGMSDVSIDLEVGSREIVLVASEVFLSRKVTVEVEEGRTANHYAPELGSASIRAFPENATLTIDGLKAKDLPLNDMPIVEGTHTFRFQWPSGRSNEQSVVVQKGKRVYVTGQY